MLTVASGFTRCCAIRARGWVEGADGVDIVSVERPHARVQRVHDRRHELRGAAITFTELAWVQHAKHVSAFVARDLGYAQDTIGCFPSRPLEVPRIEPNVGLRDLPASVGLHHVQHIGCASGALGKTCWSPLTADEGHIRVTVSGDRHAPGTDLTENDVGTSGLAPRAEPISNGSFDG